MSAASAPLCARCRYQLSGVPTDDYRLCTCPECGLHQELRAPTPNRPSRKALHAAIGTFAGAVAAVPAVALALGSIGDGHGDFVLARLLFPFSMLATILTDQITAPLIIFALLQFPAYGAAAGVLAPRGLRGRLLIAALALAHAIAAGLCFRD